MKRKKQVLVLAMCLGVFLLGRIAQVAAESEPRVGMNIGSASFSAPLTAADAAYLGLASPTSFTLSDIKSPYVLLESMHTT
jgi:hypothetical protein